MVLAAFCGWLAPAAVAQRPVVEIEVTGNARYSAGAVIGKSGLRIGQMVTRATLDGAVQKMFETGFFGSVKYRYDPKSTGTLDGYAVSLQITEEPPRTQIVLDIPGQEEQQLWQHLKSSDPFIDRQIPDNERA